MVAQHERYGGGQRGAKRDTEYLNGAHNVIAPQTATHWKLAVSQCAVNTPIELLAIRSFGHRFKNGIQFALNPAQRSRLIGISSDRVHEAELAFAVECCVHHIKRPIDDTPGG